MLRSDNNTSSQNWLSEYWESFIDFLHSSNLKNIRNTYRIIKACQRLEKKFHWKKRKTWEEYHSHPYEVARIFIEIHGNRISETGLIACILHDNIEDIDEENFDEIKEEFGNEVAFLVDLLSKPDKESFNGDKLERNNYYFWKFYNLQELKNYVSHNGRERWWTTKAKHASGSKRTNLNKGSISKSTIRRFAYLIWIIKICDRVHNLSTMPLDSYEWEKIQEKIQETEKYFMHLAHELYKTHPLVLDRLRKSIILAQMQINRIKAAEIL